MMIALSALLPTDPASSFDHDLDRRLMVEQQLAARDIHDPQVLRAMKSVPRHQFVLPEHESRAYQDRALPIQHQQTISQPYIVALMTQSARLSANDRVLEIGTGSGYQAAVLSEIVKEVYTIEIVEPLATSAKEKLQQLGYQNVHVRHGDGYQGWEEEAPFDAIIITAAAPRLPKPLIDQLKVGGRMVVPVDNEQSHQDLLLYTRSREGMQAERITGVRFVPMTGEVRQ